MAWGISKSGSGIGDLVERLRKNDPGLRSLHLFRSRRLNEADIADLCNALSENTCLTELNISNHQLSEQGVQIFAQAMVDISVNTLSLGNSSFGDSGMRVLCSGLAQNNSIHVLDCEKKGLGAAGADAIGELLSLKSALTSLTIAQNALTKAGLQALCSRPWRSLTVLDIRQCGLIGSDLSALAEAPSLAQLTKLLLGGNTLGPSAGPFLAVMMTRAEQLTTLQLEDTQLEDEGFVPLASSISGGCPPLTTLDVSSCNLGEKACAALASTFKRGLKLQRLFLSHNTAIDNGSLAGMAEELSKLNDCALTSMNLSQIQVGPEAMAALARISSLTDLSLLGCSLGKQGVAALLSAVAVNDDHLGMHALKHLCLSACGIDRECMERIAAALTAGSLPNLTELEVGANPIAQGDDILVMVELLAESRPNLAVHWRATGECESAQQASLKV